MIVDKETYLKIKNEKPNEEFLNQCREETKMFRKPKDNFQKLKDYIIQEKDKMTTGDIEQWIYERILTKMAELENNSKESIDNK